MQLEITDAFLRSLRHPARGRLELRDTEVPGLTIRVTPTGTMSWSVRAVTRDGKHTRPGLGIWPNIGVKAARNAAKICLGEIARGNDPAEEKRAARTARRTRAALPTVATRLAQWRDSRAGAWSPRYAAEVARLCTKFIEPALGKRPLVETTRQDWTDLITAHREKIPTTATWLYQLSSSFLNTAEAAGWIAAPMLPRKGLRIIAPKGDARERVLSDSELMAVWRASAELPPKPRCFVQLLITTGCRVSEAAGIAAGEIDLDERRWIIPEERAKNSTAITLPLSAPALAALAPLLADMPPGAGPGYRLLGAVRGSALQGITSVKRRLDKASGVTGWTLHDLRRTCRTGLARLGVPREIAEASMNHIGGRAGLVGTYDRHPYRDEVIAALERWQVHLAVLLDGAPLAAEVVVLRRA